MAFTKIIRPGVKNDDLTIIIPCAGVGRRMRKGPKSLLDIDNEKLITRQLRILRGLYPLADFVVILGYGADEVYKILPSYVRCVENDLYETTNVVRSLSLGLKVSVTSNVLIVYGDLVFKHKTFDGIGTKSCLLVNNKGKKDCVGLNEDNGLVEHLTYGSDNKWGQIAFLRDKELDIFKKLTHNRVYDKFFAFEILNMVIDRGGNLEAVPSKDLLVELDTVADLVKLKTMEYNI